MGHGPGQVQAQPSFQAQTGFEHAQVLHASKPLNMVNRYPDLILNLTQNLAALQICPRKWIFLWPDLPSEVVFRARSSVPAGNWEKLEYRVALYPYLTLNLARSEI